MKYYDTQNTHTTIRSAGVSPAEGCTEAPCCGKEKDMKEDRYEFPLKEWEYTTEPEPFEFPNPTKIILTRKKPRVKVEWKKFFFGDLCVQGYGNIYIVQFRVTGWPDDKERTTEFIGMDPGCERTRVIAPRRLDTSLYVDLGLDAREKWSAPVLLPESVYSRLDEITKALEDRANGGKG